MKTTRTSALVAPLPLALMLAATLAGLLGTPSSRAAATDIAQVPLVTSASTVVKPNIMFILDDSGSMSSDYMPDDANFATTRYGKQAAQCNGLAYNPDPAVTYDSPVDSKGNPITAGTDAFGSGNATQYYYTYHGTQTKLSYKYSSSGVDTSTTFYKECNSRVGASPASLGDAVFTKVNVTAASADAAKYQRWYSFYRTRITMMKSAMSLAFKPLGDKYRVGFTTISSKSTAPATNFLDINTFDSTHKDDFYTALTAASPGGNTPLRGALSKAGRYFANKAPGQASDPIQYACQKNFTILSTDGYWNTGAETSTYGPFDVTGANVGQQDGTEDRPMRDGATSTTTTVKTWKTTRTVVKQTATPTTNYTNATITTASTYGGGTGSRTDAYTGGITNSTVARCSSGSPCTITVTTGSAHGLAVGKTVYVSGASPAAYNGAFTVTGVPSSTSYTYSLPSRPSSNSTKGVTFVQGACSAGKVSTTDTWSQTDTFPLSIVTTTNATATIVTSYTQTQQTITETPHTETIVVTDGVTTSDTTVDGSPTTTSTTLTSPAATTSAPAPYTKSSTTAGSPYVKTTTGTTTGTCVAAPTNGTASAAVIATPPANTAPTNPTTLASVTGTSVAMTVSDSSVDSTKVSSNPSTTVTGGSSNSLADVAEYYFKTDLRNASLGNCPGALGTTTDVCSSGADSTGTATNAVQNMITFTIGLGTSGTLAYDKNYQKQGSGAYFDLTQGTRNWPNPTDSTGGGDPTNIDDLWHAAVNGRGRYFSAGDPNEVVSSLSSALIDIAAIVGSSSAAATSTLQPVQGDNDVYVAQFTSGKWFGKLFDYSIDPSKGTVDTTTSKWEAGAVLNARIAAGTNARKLYYFRPGSGFTGALTPFTYANLAADSKNGLFDNFCSKAGAGGDISPQQCVAFDATAKSTANSGANLVNYLAGASNDAIYRARDSALGDIVNAAPLFVGTPTFKYTENGYPAFVSGQAAAFAAASPKIVGVIYAAANDGMLHAFDRTTGDEKWAYIPSMVMPNLYKLADTAFAANHQFYVDGSPVMGDIYVGGQWKTILVGGLGGGGRGYYALDITDPNNPKALWEFTDNNLGLTYGNPIITKRTNGTWVVAFGSGYNNVSPGDGNGRLYVVDAYTGQPVVTPLVTSTGGSPAGSTATPSGMAKINAWIDSDIDNTARVYYGGDLLGNVWRFDIDSQATPSNSAFLLAQLTVGSVPQPITTKPQLAEVTDNGSKFKVVYIGTGRYLGTGDLSTTDLQSVYALKDTWASSGALGNVRTSGTLVVQSLSNGSSGTRKATANAVDWSTKNGWMVDFSLSSGERVNVNMSLAQNVLRVATNIPTPNACDAGGQSWLYAFNVGTGSAPSNATDYTVGISLGNVMVAGLTVVQLSDGQTVTITTLTSGGLRTDEDRPPPPGGTLKRTSWRELAN